MATKLSATLAVTRRLGKVKSTEKFNSLNAWGFDGWVGTITRFQNPDFTLERGKIGTRHQGTFPKNGIRAHSSMFFDIGDFCEAWDGGCRTAEDFFDFRYYPKKLAERLAKQQHQPK